ncbi:MAG TPA: divergent polysaccharide deacetylase family protein [Deltaproteobacteria bacterium]|nr:divergent polysaccharide deacetylase family protein [Deltaproteobacteria bacterium]
MRRAKAGSKAPIIIIIGVILILAGLAWFLERRMPPGPAPAPGPAVQRPQANVKLMIKGCLFNLGVHKDQVEVYEQTFQVKTEKRYTQGQLASAFGPLKAYGRVVVKDGRQVTVMVEDRSWNIEFIPEKKEAAPPQAIAPARPGRLAIIVDDMGLDLKPARQLAAIDGDLTFSVLPLRPASREVAQYLHSKGREVLLHLPMQGNGGKDPGDGAIYKDMTPEHIRTILAMDIRAVPHIRGVNNHMGSEITPDRVIMRQVMQTLKQHRLFFIDSLTASDSVGVTVAREVGLPHNARDIFLDNEQNDAYITGQLAKIKNIARKHKSAIAICHPYPQTIAVLAREVPTFKAEGITLVRVSAFARQ